MTSQFIFLQTTNQHVPVTIYKLTSLLLRSRPLHQAENRVQAVRRQRMTKIRTGLGKKTNS